MIFASNILLKKLKILFFKEQNNPEASIITDNLQQQIHTALSLGRSVGTQKSLEDLRALGIRVDQTNPISKSSQFLGLFHPPSYNQLEILKHFKVKNRSEITRSQANILIKTIFSDPANIEQWKQRPATSKVKQGILFMGGQLNSSMTQVEAQSRLRYYSKEHPLRFLEWKHIETLFLLVNSRDRLEQYNARKLTWKCFFQIYDDLKDSGTDFNNINADRIHQHAKELALVQKPRSCQIKTFAA